MTMSLGLPVALVRFWMNRDVSMDGRPLECVEARGLETITAALRTILLQLV